MPSIPCNADGAKPRGTSNFVHDTLLWKNGQMQKLIWAWTTHPSNKIKSLGSGWPVLLRRSNNSLLAHYRSLNAKDAYKNSHIFLLILLPIIDTK